MEAAIPTHTPDTIATICKVCGRPVIIPANRPGTRPSLCLPKRRRFRDGTRRMESRSRCAMIQKRADELARMALAVVDELEKAGASPDEVRACAQTVKSFVWSELNSATNALGKLAKKRPA